MSGVGVVVGGGSIEMGKQIYRFKTEGWAQDVGCADINNMNRIPQAYANQIISQSSLLRKMWVEHVSENCADSHHITVTECYTFKYLNFNGKFKFEVRLKIHRA